MSLLLLLSLPFIGSLVAAKLPTSARNVGSLWGAAVALGQGADDFLGTQGDPWDTQSDMAFAGIGAIVALGLFAGLQDRQIARGVRRGLMRPAPARAAA